MAIFISVIGLAVYWQSKGPFTHRTTSSVVAQLCVRLTYDVVRCVNTAVLLLLIKCKPKFPIYTASVTTNTIFSLRQCSRITWCT